MELTKTFGKCVRSVAGGALPDRAQRLMLEEVMMRYPWFTTARLLYSGGSGTGDPALKLHMLAYPRPDFMLVQISPEELGIGMKKGLSPQSESEIRRPELESEMGQKHPQEPKLEHERELMPVRNQESERELAEDAIDRFLSRGGHRIVPDENTTDEDVAEGSARFDITDDVLSEDLAEIYAAQGLNRQAIEIYQRLCLLNPEKSVYFASIIDKITV